jgi:hypothetical protein
MLRGELAGCGAAAAAKTGMGPGHMLGRRLVEHSRVTHWLCQQHSASANAACCSLTAHLSREMARLQARCIPAPHAGSLKKRRGLCGGYVVAALGQRCLELADCDACGRVRKRGGRGRASTPRTAMHRVKDSTLQLRRCRKLPGGTPGSYSHHNRRDSLCCLSFRVPVSSRNAAWWRPGQQVLRVFCRGPFDRSATAGSCARG